MHIPHSGCFRIEYEVVVNLAMIVLKSIAHVGVHACIVADGALVLGLNCRADCLCCHESALYILDLTAGTANQPREK